MARAKTRKPKAPKAPKPQRRGTAGSGYNNYSYFNGNSPIAGADLVQPFPADVVSYMKNDGAVDVLIAFDQGGQPASTARKPITLKAGEVMQNIPVQTAQFATQSTGAASAIRVLGHY